MTGPFIHGLLLALGLILPLGVQNVFILNQGAVHKSMLKAMPAVLTASLCDTVLIGLAVAGVSAAVLGIGWLKGFLLLAGTLFLLYMGFATWKSKPGQDTGDQIVFTAKRQAVFAASVSLLNPHAILDIVGVIGTSSLAYSGQEKLVFALTCILVSWLWFLGLAFAGNLAGRLSNAGAFLTALNKVSALIIWGTAVYLGEAFLKTAV